MRNYYFLIPHLQNIGKQTGHLEFEQEGEVEIFFVPIKSGVYEFLCEGPWRRGMVDGFIKQWFTGLITVPGFCLFYNLLILF